MRIFVFKQCFSKLIYTPSVFKQLKPFRPFNLLTFITKTTFPLYLRLRTRFLKLSKLRCAKSFHYNFKMSPRKFSEEVFRSHNGGSEWGNEMVKDFYLFWNDRFKDNSDALCLHAWEIVKCLRDCEVPER